MNSVKELIDNSFKNKEPWQIVTITTGSVLGAVWIWNFCNKDESLIERGKKQVFKLARYIPSVRDKIRKELDTINETFEKDALIRVKDIEFVTHLPLQGLNHDRVIEEVKKYVHIGNFIALNYFIIKLYGT